MVFVSSKWLVPTYFLWWKITRTKLFSGGGTLSMLEILSDANQNEI